MRQIGTDVIEDMVQRLGIPDVVFTKTRQSPALIS